MNLFDPDSLVNAYFSVLKQAISETRNTFEKKSVLSPRLQMYRFLQKVNPMSYYSLFVLCKQKIRDGIGKVVKI